jgi:diguanylate cyclase (GGDEF)-like protein
VFAIDIVLSSDRYQLISLSEIRGHLRHEAGDRLLCRAADALAQETGADGFVARLGGDEFVIVAAAHCDEAAIDALAVRICRRLNAPFDLEEGTVAIGASIGIASGQGTRTDATALLRNADFALYQAKRIRATFRRFDPRETPPARPTSVSSARIQMAASAS